MRDLMELVGAEVLARWIERWLSQIVVLVVAACLGWMLFNKVAPLWAQMTEALKCVGC